MTFFVKYNGDLEKNPLNRGVTDFADYESAFAFAKRMTNKGLATTIYSGEIMQIQNQKLPRDLPRWGGLTDADECV